MRYLLLFLVALPLLGKAQISEIASPANKSNKQLPGIQQQNSGSYSNSVTPRCGASLLFNSSNSMQRQAFDEKLYRNYINSTTNRTGSVGDSTIYKLPLAIHIVHQNGVENIPDLAIYQAVDLLNKAFKNQAPFDTIKGTNTHIQFCIPWGSITRHVSPLTNMYVDNNSDDAALKQIGVMDNLSYINIWVVKSITSVSQGPGVAGYATFPYAHGTATDGIVIEADWVNNDPDAILVLIHEMGHYLGLYHTFEGGCSNTNCMLQGDRVCDTPPDNSTAPNCSGVANTCHSDEDDASAQNPFRSVALGGLGDQPDMINYMDYGNQGCSNHFTQGQRNRMRAGLLDTRHSLLEHIPVLCTNCNSSAIVSLNLPDTLLSGVTHTITVNVSDTTGMKYFWFFGSQTITTQSFTYTSQTSGTLPFMLIVYNPSLGCFSQLYDTLTFYCPAASAVINASPYGAYSVGETVVFSTPDNGFAYTWQIDGVTVGTGPQYSHLISTNYGCLLTLTANNGSCAATSLPYYINPNNCSASKENNTWHFGNGAGINFNTNPPASIPGSFTGSGDHQDFEGCAVISDANGAALYASNGTQVWDAQTGVNLANGGDSLIGSWHSTQSALFVPKFNSNLIYLFTVQDEGGIYQAPGGIYYSIIDKNTNALTVKNQLLTAPVSEKVTAVKNMTGDGIWVIAHKYNSNQFYAWLVSGAGISAPVISSAGTAHSPSYMQDPAYIPIGQMVASPTGQKLAVANSGLAFVEVFDFNNANGMVSNAITYSMSAVEQPYGVAFSPNERYLYACNGNLSDNSWGTYRWDLQNGSTATREVIAIGKNSARGSMQLAPDGKIYCAYGVLDYKFLGVISNPNATNVANCGFQKDGFKLLYGSTLFGLPNPVQSVLANTIPNIIGADRVCLSGSPQTQQYSFNPTANASYTWTHKGSNAAVVLTQSTLSMTFTQAGTDTLIVKRHASCGDSYDTLYIKSQFPPAAFNIGHDTTLCKGVALTLNAGAGMYDYTWSNNTRGQTATFTTDGKVWVQVITNAGCVLSDTLIISRYELPGLDLGRDTSLCGLQTLTLTAPAAVDSYSWNTGATTQSIVADSGKYSVSVTKYGCTFTDEINILQDVIPNILPADTVMQPCTTNQATISLPLGYSSYAWQKPNGGIVNTPNIMLSDAGWYRVTYSNACGTARDSVFYKTRFFWSVDSIVTCADTTILITDKTIASIIWRKFGTSTVVNLPTGMGYTQSGDTTKIFSSGDFTFIGWDTAGCSVFQQVVIMLDTVLTPPAMHINLGNDISACNGGVVVLDAGSGFEKYQWNTGSPNQSITTYGFGQYWVKANYCGYSYSDTITISSVASTALINGDTLLCQNSTGMLMAFPANGSYIWDSLGVQIQTNSNTLIINQAGIYRVINQACDAAQWSLPFVVIGKNCVTGLAESATANYELLIYPNPSTGIFNFSHRVNARVTNSLGQIILNMKNIDAVDLSGQSVGMFFIEIVNDKGQVIQRTKIVKE